MYRIRLHGPWSVNVHGLASEVRVKIPGQVWPLESSGREESGDLFSLTATRHFNRPTGLAAEQALHLAVWATRDLSAAYFNEVECEQRGSDSRSLFLTSAFPAHSLRDGLDRNEAEPISFSCFSLSQERLRAYNSVNLVYKIAASESLRLTQVVLGIQDRGIL